MELRQLHYFLAVAEALNFTRASEKLHVAQPALSRQIRKLEDELGVQLLERDSRLVRLTPEGVLFLEDVSEILELLEAAEARVKRAQRNPIHILSLGYAPSLVAPWLPRILSSFSSRLPNTKVQLYDMDNEELVAGIRERTLDAGIFPDQAVPRSELFVLQHLYKIGLEVALPMRHPLSEKSTLCLRDLAPECLIGYNRKQFPDYFDSLRRMFTAASQPLLLGLEVDSGMSLLAMVRGGQGVAIVSTTVRLAQVEGLEFRSLEPEPEGCNLSLVTHRDIPVRRLKLFREVISDSFRV